MKLVATHLLLPLLTTASFMAAPNVRADGFVCNSADGDLTVRVYNQTQPARGTRSVAVMVLSDNSVKPGNRTIARFYAERGRLASYGPRYAAQVDLSAEDAAGQRGEYVGGTRLMYVAAFTLDVNFNYSVPVPAGTLLDGNLTIQKTNGQLIGLDMTCERYLKN